jgi:hypothetical protein
MQSVPITTNVVSSNPAHGEVHSIQHYLIKCVNDTTGRWRTPVSSTNKTDLHDITEILIKVALNTTAPANIEVYSMHHSVIKFVSNLRQVGGFLRILRFLSPIKLTATI